MGDALTKLRKLEKRLSAQLEKVRQQASKEEEKEQLPSLKKKYEGKYWIYMNSCGPGLHWPVYTYCKKIVSLDTASVFSFQTDGSGKIEFSEDENTGFFLFENSISKKTFDLELEKVKKRIAGMMK